ncbi:MAG: prepilin-type N-terminal cleavage/methylation domain-containing protein [Planctomycetota bacterium]|nr:prepilin-type N-terminal cleavage/methylation domain-containing protein [Planctomycetota bacterium]
MKAVEKMGVARVLGRAPRVVKRRCGGFTMLELSLAMTILVVALVATAASNMRMNSLRRSNRDRVVAHNAVQSIAENVHALAREGVSDPSGFGNHVVAALSAGGQLGTTFDVPELTPITGEAHVGSIRVVFDETMSDAALGAELGLPRDLNGDGDALDTNATNSSRLLPVVVTLRWRSQSGDQRIVHPFYVFGY